MSGISDKMLGTRLGDRYEILHEIGRGGMGVVYLAQDPILERKIALKLVTQSALTPEMGPRLKREARTVAVMDHPGIVPVHDFGEHEGCLFFVMPFVSGKNLRAYLQDRSLQLGEIVEIGIQVADALDYSHSLGVVHRDIKPENIMITREDPDPLRVRVTDFGLAIGSAQPRITRSGLVVGTVAYLTPEQIAEDIVDARCDIYSLGTVLYECLAGQTPFDGEIQALLYRIAHEYPAPFSTLGVAIDDDLQQIVMRCLEKDPAKRPQRARDLAEQLRFYRRSLEEGGRDRIPLASSRSQTIQYARPAQIPFVGRENEFGELQRMLNDSVLGECHVVLVSGEAGIGKSRMLEELENLARARKIRCLHGRFIEQNHAFPYQGFCEVIQEYCRTRITGSSPGSGDFSDLTPELFSLFPVLTEIPELRARSSGEKIATSPESGAMEDKTQIFELLARTLGRIGGGKPLGILLEDVHLADVSIEALQYVARRLSPTPTLIVGTYRTTEVKRAHPLIKMIQHFQGDRRFRLIELHALSRSEHSKFIAKILGRVENNLTEKIYEITEGNPYFTREMIRSLIAAGNIVKNETGTWMLSGENALSLDSLPETIQQAVERRVQHLPDLLKEVLSMGAVVGRTFEVKDLEPLCESISREPMEVAIDRLIQEGFLEEERQSRGDKLIFASGILREVLYGALTRRRRKSLHRRYAEDLEKRHSGRLEKVYAELLNHYSSADVPEKVIEYGFKLVKRDLAAFSAPDAIRAARTVLESMDESETTDQPLKAEMKTLLSSAYRLEGNVDAALSELKGVIEIHQTHQDTDRALSAMVAAAETAWQGRRTQETRFWIDRGMPLARAHADRQSLRRFLSLGATVANLRAEYEQAKLFLEELERLQPAQDREQIQPGGKLVVAMTIQTQASHPMDIRFAEEAEILANVFETLVTNDAEGNLLPALCEKWEVLNEGRTFLFTLRPGMRFHNGDLVTAGGVKACMEASLPLAAGYVPPAFAVICGVGDVLKKQATEVSGITAVSETVLQIDLTGKLPIFPSLLTDDRTAIACGAADGGPCLSGTGPFRMTTLEPQRILLERNSEWWKAFPMLDSIEFRTSLNASEIASGFRAGKFDIARDLLPSELEQIFRDRRSRPHVYEVARKNTYFVLFNMHSPAASIAELRKALCSVVSVHDLVRRTLGRFGEPAEGIFPPGILGYDPERRKRTVSLDKAREILASAGVRLPLTLKAAIHPGFHDRYAALLQALFQTWSELGISVVVETPDSPAFVERAANNQGIDMLIGRWIAAYEDPDYFTCGVFHSVIGHYSNFYSSPGLDRMMEEARTGSEPAGREKQYRRIEDQVLQSHYFLPLFHDTDFRVAAPSVRGIAMRGSAPYLNYSEIAKAEPEPSTRIRGGGIIHVPMTGDLQSLDPSLVSLAVQAEVIPSIFETLTREAEGARIVPWLASAFQAEEGGRRFRFHLQDNIRFHDGRRLTARDVRYSFEHLLLNQQSNTRWLLSPIRGARSLLQGERGDLEGFRILKPFEFIIDLEEPVSFFPALLAYHAAAIVQEGSLNFSGSCREGCVGTGPFRVRHFEPGSKLELEANPDYWKPALPKSDGLIFHFGITPQDIAAGFRSGRFSIAWDLFPVDVESLRHDADFASKYRETPRLSTYFAALNIYDGPLANDILRHEFVSSINTEEMIRRTLGAVATPAHGLIPPGLLGHEERDHPAAQHQAPRLKGLPIELVCATHSVYQGQYSLFATELFNAWRENGFHIQLKDAKFEYEKQTLAETEADVVLSRWLGDYPDSDNFLHDLLHTQKGWMGKYCGTPEIDELIGRGRSETDPAVRHQIYRQVEQLIADRALLVPLFHEQAYGFFRPEVEGFDVNFSGPVVAYEKLWIDSPDRHQPWPEPPGVAAAGNQTLAETLGDLLLIQGEYKGAEDAYRAAKQERLSLHGKIAVGDEARFLQKLAMLAQKLGRYEEALKHCKEGVDLVQASDPAACAMLQALAGLTCTYNGRYQEALGWCDLASNRLHDLQDPDSNPVEAMLSRARGNFLLGTGRPLEAIVEFERGFHLCEKTGNRWESSIALFNLGAAYAQSAQGDLALTFFQRALEEKSRIGDKWGLAYTHWGMAKIKLEAGDMEASLQLAESGMKLAAEIRDPKIISLIRLLMGEIHFASGALDRSEKEFQLALREASSVLALPEIIDAHLGLSAVNREHGRFIAAVKEATTSEKLAEEAELKDLVARSLLSLGDAYAAQGEYLQSEKQYAKSLAAAKQLGQSALHFAILASIGQLQLLRGEYDEALSSFQQIHGAAGSGGDPLQLGSANLGLAEVHFRRGETQDAFHCAEAALQYFKTVNSAKRVASVYEFLTRLCVQITEFRRAETYAHAAIELYESMGDHALRQLGRAYLSLGYVYYEGVRPTEMVEAFNTGLQHLERYGDRAGIAEGYRAMAVPRTKAEPEQAVYLIRKSLEMSREVGSLLGQALSYGDLGEVHRRMGRITAAADAFADEHKLLRQIGYERGLAVNAFHRASIYYYEGSLHKAMEAVTENILLSEKVGNMGRLFGFEFRGQIQSDLGFFNVAQIDLDRALDLGQRLRHAERLANIHRTRAECFLASGMISAAEEETRLGREIAKSLPEETLKEHGFLPRERLAVMQSRILLARGEHAQAGEMLRIPLKAFQDLDTPIQELDALLLQLEITIQNGERVSLQSVGDLVKRAADLGVAALHGDALFFLARFTGDLQTAQHAYKVASKIGAPLRIVRCSRLLARLLEKKGDVLGSTEQRVFADGILRELAEYLPSSSRATTLTFWKQTLA